MTAAISTLPTLDAQPVAVDAEKKAKKPKPIRQVRKH
jgi:hypothetical protein